MADEGRSRTLLWIVVGGGAFFLFVLAVFTLVYLSVRTDRRSQFGGFGDKIGVVDLEGVILTSKTTVKQLKEMADDGSIKAIVLHINTPGGGAAASEEIYREVRRIRDEKKKTIVASVETVGASGGYYVASATSKIFANNASIVGSIGVIAEWYNYADLLRWAKLKQVLLKAGEFKDTGNPARDMTPAEREYMQGIINSLHGQFIHAVAEGRKVKDEEIRPLADGKVWTGKEAFSLKLVDQIGDFQSAIYETAKSVGIKGEPQVVRAEKEKRSLLDMIFGDSSDWFPDRGKLMETHVGFYYLWK